MNSIFQASKVLAPGTHNYISMKGRKTDRSQLNNDFVSTVLGEGDRCRDTPDPVEVNTSSIVVKHYNSQHCTKTKAIKMFEKSNNCSIFPLFGTFDLDSPLPMCNRSVIQKMMKTTKNMMMKENTSDPTCLPACVEEHVELSSSFTVLTGQQVVASSAAWNLTSLQKEDVILMEVFFSSSEVLVGTHFV